MRNFNLYDGDMSPFKIFEEALNRKRNEDEQNLINKQKDIIKSQYDKYELAVKENNVETLDSAGFAGKEKDALLGMYDYNCKTIEDFKTSFKSKVPKFYKSTCPYCTISRANTIEHILPKGLYPEFAINVLNLIPACSDCNSKKGEVVLDRKDNKKFTINYYTDILPKEQYLFVDISIGNYDNYPICKFKLENPEEIIDPELFDLIKSHYYHYGLLTQFEEQYDEVLKSLRRAFSISNDYDRSVIILSEELEEDKEIYGYNYWQTILQLELIKSPIFKEYILSKYEHLRK